MYYRTYKFRLKPNLTQAKALDKMFELVIALTDLFYEYYFTIHNMEYKDMLRFLISINPELSKADQCALLCELSELNNRYNTKKKYKDNFRYNTNYFKFSSDGIAPLTQEHIYLPTVGAVRYYNNEYAKGIRFFYRFTVYKTIDNKYFVDILANKKSGPPKKSELYIENSIGLDYSSPNLYVDNEGNSPNPPHYLKDRSQTLRDLKRQLSRFPKDSKHYKKALKQFILLHTKISNQRRDYAHKLSTAIANKYDYVFIENLNLNDIAAYKQLGKSTKDNAYRKFVRTLKYKMDERGKKLIEIDKFYPSTRKCNWCGNVIEHIDLEARTWQCPKCKMNHNRDVNAAINIRNRGIELVKQTADRQPAC